MTLTEFLETVAATLRAGLASIDAATGDAALDAARNDLVGRRSGRLTDLMKVLPTLPADARREAGSAINEARQTIDLALATRRDQLLAVAPPARALDDSMPSRTVWRGAQHPVTLVIEEIADIFRTLGFTIATGPEAEHEWYNFGALNFPADHPAQDMHDTIYLGDGALLRTHTSPVQVRTLQGWPPPIRILGIGNVYRRDVFDASHAPMFAQIEGMAVDEGVSFVDLKATLATFATRLFGRTETRLRPSYFPFTEPSAEMDVRCTICGGAGCPSCKGTGWMEVLGSGMIHPAVLSAAGVDAERYTGWAFGMGPARMAKLRYGIPDIRLMYESDVRFLEQFAP